MSSFKEMLMQDIESLESGGDFDKVDSPYSNLKHSMVQLTKDNTDELVRILPPVEQGEHFAVGFREIFLSTRNSKNKKLDLVTTLPLHPNPDEYESERKIAEYVKNENVPSNYPKSKPQVRYFVNVIKLQQQNGQYVHETDQQGNPVIRVMKLPVTAYQAVLNRMVDPHLTDPEGVTNEYGIISDQNAYPFSISRTGQQTDTRYYAQTYERELGALPENWREFAEDLNYQATPTEEFNKDYMDYIFAVHDGREAEYWEERKGGSAPNNGGGNTESANVPPTNTPPQDGFGGQPQQQGGFQQAQQGGFNQQPQGQQGGFQQPQGNTQNPPQQEPQAQNGGFNAGNFGGNQGGFNQQAPEQGGAQDQGQQPPQQTDQDQQPQQKNEPQTNTAGKDVNSLLDQVRNQVNNG